MRYLALFFTLVTLSTQPGLASDHIDGPVTTKHGVTDITDLYAFPTPGKPGNLSLVLDVSPAVLKNGHFSDRGPGPAGTHRFLRQLQPD